MRRLAAVALLMLAATSSAPAWAGGGEARTHGDFTVPPDLPPAHEDPIPAEIERDGDVILSPPWPDRVWKNSSVAVYGVVRVSQMVVCELYDPATGERKTLRRIYWFSYNVSIANLTLYSYAEWRNENSSIPGWNEPFKFLINDTLHYEAGVDSETWPIEINSKERIIDPCGQAQVIRVRKTLPPAEVTVDSVDVEVSGDPNAFEVKNPGSGEWDITLTREPEDVPLSLVTTYRATVTWSDDSTGGSAAVEKSKEIRLDFPAEIHAEQEGPPLFIIDEPYGEKQAADKFVAMNFTLENASVGFRLAVDWKVYSTALGEYDYDEDANRAPDWYEPISQYANAYLLIRFYLNTTSGETYEAADLFWTDAPPLDNATLGDIVAVYRRVEGCENVSCLLAHEPLGMDDVVVGKVLYITAPEGESGVELTSVNLTLIYRQDTDTFVLEDLIYEDARLLKIYDDNRRQEIIDYINEVHEVEFANETLNTSINATLNYEVTNVTVKDWTPYFYVLEYLNRMGPRVNKILLLNERNAALGDDNVVMGRLAPMPVWSNKDYPVQGTVIVWPGQDDVGGWTVRWESDYWIGEQFFQMRLFFLRPTLADREDLMEWLYGREVKMEMEGGRIWTLHNATYTPVFFPYFAGLTGCRLCLLYMPPLVTEEGELAEGYFNISIAAKIGGEKRELRPVAPVYAPAFVGLATPVIIGGNTADVEWNTTSLGIFYADVEPVRGIGNDTGMVEYMRIYDSDSNETLYETTDPAISGAVFYNRRGIMSAWGDPELSTRLILPLGKPRRVAIEFRTSWNTTYTVSLGWINATEERIGGRRRTFPAIGWEVFVAAILVALGLYALMWMVSERRR